jgi:hypothetical protein
LNLDRESFHTLWYLLWYACILNFVSTV